MASISFSTRYVVTNSFIQIVNNYLLQWKIWLLKFSSRLVIHNYQWYKAKFHFSYRYLIDLDSNFVGISISNKGVAISAEKNNKSEILIFNMQNLLIVYLLRHSTQ